MYAGLRQRSGCSARPCAVTANLPPVLSAPELVQARDREPVAFQVSAEDPEDDVVTLSAAALPPGAAFEGGVFSWTPPFDASAASPFTLSFSGSDGRGSGSVSVRIAVADTNQAPRIAFSGPTTVNEHATLVLDVLSAVNGVATFSGLSIDRTSPGHLAGNGHDAAGGESQ